MVRKRGWGGITTDILEACIKPEKKMRIMYRANLNFERFDKYLQELLSKGLVENHTAPDGKVTYQTSPKGKELLAALKKAQDLFDSPKKPEGC